MNTSTNEPVNSTLLITCNAPQIMKIRKAFIFFFLLVLVPIVWGTSILTAQAKISGVPPVIHFSKNDYEGGTQNWSICQGVNGLLYVGNNQGLL